MKKRVQAFVCAMALLGAGSVGLGGVARASEGCYNCGSGSAGGCQQCPYGAKDTFDARKACEKRGCKISGTGSCSSAANVKKCSLDDAKSIYEAVAWTAVSSVE